MTKTTDERAMDDIVDAVLSASRALVALSARSIAGVRDVTLPQYRMLVVLDGGPTNLSGLARALDVALSTALRMVDRLISAGLVARTIPPANRRETHPSITPRVGARSAGSIPDGGATCEPSSPCSRRPFVGTYPGRWRRSRRRPSSCGG